MELISVMDYITGLHGNYLGNTFAGTVLLLLICRIGQRDSMHTIQAGALPVLAGPVVSEGLDDVVGLPLAVHLGKHAVRETPNASHSAMPTRHASYNAMS